MSLLGKKWVIRNENKSLNVIAKLLQNRGIDSPEKAASFFEGKIEHLHKPELLKDMDKAVERIRKAIECKEKIMIFGDYDVDGITATAILYDFLKMVEANVHYTLPHREKDGYGLQSYFIDRFKEQDIKLIVTVDCGTANLKEIERANELGIEVVITDHHTMPKTLPPALAIVNPKRPDCDYPNKDICGSSISYKLVSALAPHFLTADKSSTYLSQQLGIVALGVVGDCMAITGENRILVREGLKSLMKGNNPGISALLAEAGLALDKITSGMLAFQVGPRINAAGRLDTPEHAFQLLIGNLEKAVTLNELNEKRRAVSKQCIHEAVAQIKTFPSIPNIIVIKSEKWGAGLLGLIASDISEKFGRPTIVMQERENEMIGSMRSLNDFDITGALRTVAVELFTAFGGHVMAGGFTLPKKNLEDFLKRVEKAGNELIDPAQFVGTLHIDCEILPHEINFETCGKLSRLEPFGAENPEPTLLIKNARISNIRPVGKTADHLQFPVEYGEKTFRAIAFRFGAHLDKIDPTKPHDIVCNLEANEWNGNKRLQLRVVDIKESE